MADVPTARGTIDSSALGATLMHEHVFIQNPEIQQNYPDTWPDEEQVIADAVARLDEVKALGIDTIVDLTVIGLGRFVPRVAKVAARTDVNIVVATGLYTFSDLPSYLRSQGPGTIRGGPEPMVEWFVKDIQEGIGGTGIRAGILKCVTDEAGVTPGVERVLRAVAQAQRATGVPISTHTNAGLRRGLDQQRIFAEEGVDLSRVTIGHSGDTTDIGYLEELMAAGSYIGMDRFGIERLLSFEDRVETVAQLCRRGHAGQITLSHDASCTTHGSPREIVSAASPRWNFGHISRDVLPALREHGVTEEQIHQMMVDNPRAIFERQGAY